jgi:GntR family transcriptional regulator, rspAB operon transcriptional repressor
VQFDRVRILSLPQTTPVDVLIAQHRAILNAVLDGDPDSAEKAIRAHLSEVLRIADDLAIRHPDPIETGH